MEKNLVSVVMPVRNAAATVGPALQSIVQQTFQDWECIVVDDGSSDATLDIIKAFQDERIRVVADGAHRGLATRLNEAIGLARGDFIARMDADDVCYPRRFQVQLEKLKSDPTIDLTGTWIVVFRGAGEVFGKRTAPVEHADLFTLLGAIPIPHPTFLGRVEWFRDNPYSPASSGFEDQLLLLRSWASSRFAVIPHVLLGYREEALSVRKQLRYRSSYFRSRKELADALGWPRTATILGAQAGKMVLDAVSISTGAHYRLLRKRARSITPAEVEEWRAVWATVSAG